MIKTVSKVTYLRTHESKLYKCNARALQCEIYEIHEIYEIYELYEINETYELYEIYIKKNIYEIYKIYEIWRAGWAEGVNWFNRVISRLGVTHAWLLLRLGSGLLQNKQCY